MRSSVQPSRPLPAKDFHLLFVLLEGPMHGYGLVKAIEERTGGRVRLEPTNLYRRIRRFVEEGLVAEASAPVDAEGDDPRRRYYTLTDRGRTLLGAEVARMRDIVAEAEGLGLVTDRPPTG